MVLACFHAGLGDPAMLYTKAVMDLIVSAMMASTLGIGVSFAALPLFAYQAVLILCAGFLQPHMSEDMLTMFSCAGGLVTIPIGTNMMGLSRVKIADLIPVLILAPLLIWLGAAVSG